MRASRHVPAYLICFGFLAAYACVFNASSTMKVKWANVPPPPSRAAAVISALGDRQYAFRTGALMLQNFGDVGWDTTPLKDYDYDKVGQWLRLQDQLDPLSSHTPYIAAYYFGGSQDPSKIRPVIDYLAMVGRRPGKGAVLPNWRWMVQAVYLARFKYGDMQLALNLANELAAMYRPGMPAWVREMPAYVMNAKGDKASAYALMMSNLKSNASTMQPQEVTSTMHYICQVLLSPAEAKDNPMCKTLPAR